MTATIENELPWRDFREMDFPDGDHFIYELTNGEFSKKTAPKPMHQLVSQRLEFVLEITTPPRLCELLHRSTVIRFTVK